MQDRLALRQIAEKLNITPRGARKRALQEGWPSCGSISINGKPTKIFEVAALPASVREKLGSAPLSLIHDPASSSRESGASSAAPGLITRGQTCPAPALAEERGFFSAAAGTDTSAVPVTQGPGLLTPAPFSPRSEADIEMDIFSQAPQWARSWAEKWLSIMDACAGMKGAELQAFIETWNVDHPEMKTSYPRVLDMRKRHQDQGITGLLPKYGKNVGDTCVLDEWFAQFRAAYLKEGAPSLKSCWTSTLGYAMKTNSALNDRIHAKTGEVLGADRGGIDPSTFPSPAAFLRRLEREVPEDAVFLARHGRKAWNRKFASYIDRDYSQLLPGECIVSDHAQVDVAVMLQGGKVCFPWITAWRCFKTGKWLGWLNHAEAPKSDHVFQSFYYAVREYGLCTDVYIDNGKDYRCRDFAGGRRYHRVDVDERKTTAMLSLLGITPRFALPYNAQSKTIERDFLKNKEWFSKHMPGYRGGNVTERPEVLAEEIKRGRILHWEDYQACMNRYILEVLNQMPSNGKALQGRSPDEAWHMEQREIRKVSADALKLFCMRTTRPLTIGRNGVLDSELGMRYWAEWMDAQKGEKVYLRRDVNAWQEAWCFRAENDEYLGKAQLAETAAALARTDIEKAQLTKLIARKRQAEKITRSYIETRDVPEPAEAVARMAAGVAAINSMRGYEPQERREVNVLRMANTEMDEVVLREREMQRTGTYDLSAIQPQERRAKVIHLFEADKEAYDKSSE